METLNSSQLKNTPIFKKINLSNKDIKGKRAEMFAVDIIEASDKILRDRRDKIRKLEKDLMNLEDFHPDSSYSLKVLDKPLDAEAWLKSINSIKLQIKLENDALQIEQSTHIEYCQPEKVK